MGKAGRIKAVKKMKHGRGSNDRVGLGKQIIQFRDEIEGRLSVKSLSASHGCTESASDDETDTMTPSKTQQILKQARQQKEEIDQEYVGSVAPRINVTQHDSARWDEEDVFPVEEDEDYSEDVFEELTAEEEHMLSQYMPASQAKRQTLADLIMQKIDESESKGQRPQQAVQHRLPQKVVTVYTQVGKLLRVFKSGSLPKAIRVVPSLRNWEEVLFLTDPERWSSQAVSAVTRIFAGNLKPKMAQRYYATVILPHVRDDIDRHKRLNFHLYMALRRAMFKPAAFFKGILLPLAEDGCTAREAVILCSILSRISIPMMHSAASILLLSELPYSGPTTMFMKALLNKKYSLPYQVIQAMVKWFCAFQEDERKMTVIWHQTLLVFVQRYKLVIKPEHREEIKTLLRSQSHHEITPEIRRELFAPASVDLRPDVTGMILEQ